MYPGIHATPGHGHGHGHGHKARHKEVAIAVAPMEMERAKDLAESILKLKKLLDAGALTQEEFDAKKVELLSRV
eukprot:273002-Prymnesium_polylepis.1